MPKRKRDAGAPAAPPPPMKRLCGADPRTAQCPQCHEALPHFDQNLTPFSCGDNAYCVLCAAPAAQRDPPTCDDCNQRALEKLYYDCKILSKHTPLQLGVRMLIEEDDYNPFELLCRDCERDNRYPFSEDGSRVCEMYQVTDVLWDALYPEDDKIIFQEGAHTFKHGKFIICLSCIEKKLGRALTCEDFGLQTPRRISPRVGDGPPGHHLPPLSARLRARFAATRQDH